jgi:hypothetical protein
MPAMQGAANFLVMRKRGSGEGENGPEVVQRLNMGAVGYTAHCLRKAQREKHAILRD